MIRLLVHVPCDDMLRKFSLFSLRKNKAKERHYCCLELCNARWSQTLFKAHSDKKQQTQVSTQDILVRYKEKKYKYDGGQRFPEKLGKSSSLEMLRTWDTDLSILL